jgi:hypothetical protein
MLKRLLVLVLLAASLTLSACCVGGGCFRCERPCYGKSFCRAGRQMVDFVDVYFLNYDKNNPYRCDPCLGD